MYAFAVMVVIGTNLQIYVKISLKSEELTALLKAITVYRQICADLFA